MWITPRTVPEPTLQSWIVLLVFLVKNQYYNVVSQSIDVIEPEMIFVFKIYKIIKKIPLFTVSVVTGGGFSP